MVETVMPALQRAARSTAGRVALECVIVFGILAGAVNWGTWYWNQSYAIGRHPSFYQLYFEPAVMLACGKGFAVAQPQIPAMTKFLQEQTSEFDCKDIPPDAKLGTQGLYQGSWRYLLTAVAWTWRYTGVSWRRVGPAAGVLFGLTIAAAYGIFRLGMGRVLSVLLAWVLSLSTLHLLNLPNIRDYSKAPFALLLIFLLGLLVTRAPSWRRVLWIGAAYGVVMGIGYGFRADLLINIPAFVLTMFLFIDAKWRERLQYGPAALAVCLGAFYIAALPIFAAADTGLNCTWHVAVLGLGDDPVKALDLREPVYDWLDGYTDEFAYATATSYAARLEPGVKHIEYCGDDYNRVTRALMLDVARHTPADILMRAYSSSLHMVQLPLRWRKPPMPHVAVDFYKARMALTSHATDAGVFLVAAAVFLITAFSIRLGLFAIGFILYFGGYPAVQFGNRHFFHLEFITWWAFGFLLQQGVSWIVATVRKRPKPSVSPERLRRAALVLAGTFAALVGALWLARWYQSVEMDALVQQYANAQMDEIVTVPAPGGLSRVTPVKPRTDPETADLIEVDVNEWRCSNEMKLNFVYDPSHNGFARDMELRTDLPHTTTRIILPVYATFQGVSVGNAPAGCLAGVYRVEHPERFTLMPKLTLRPGWEDQPLYQSLDGLGIEPPPDE